MIGGFERPLGVAALLEGFTRPWFVAGGWAIDLFLGRVTRSHNDIEVAILRADQRAIPEHLAGWQLARAANHVWQPWGDEWLELPIHQIRAHNLDAPASPLDIMLNEADQQSWRYRRNPAVTRPLAAIGLRSELGVPFLSPEIVLLYKAKGPRAKDDTDFANVVELLGDERRAWLVQSIRACHPDCPWLADALAI